MQNMLYKSIFDLIKFIMFESIPVFRLKVKTREVKEWDNQ